MLQGRINFFYPKDCKAESVKGSVGWYGWVDAVLGGLFLRWVGGGMRTYEISLRFFFDGLLPYK
nr:MAG TPA: hypothetical protein [Caudoviricetes sp.]